ncbi:MULTISPECIES: cytochrome P450 [unclassified Streptomyces]|uniref:cytochrome P450 n=1 Tax=unclassified Streptomyces TaxID=2593676 RepID=UPI00225517DE|nr:MULTISPECIES: cytochrome P450 [unclassified Streptomyces]MCX5127445.1 cytochrome P450 [Streptomyces sp. NBC_00347]
MTTDPTIRTQTRTKAGTKPGAEARSRARTKARRRDRRVYLRSHPLLFALLAATRGRPVRRLGGGTLLVHGTAAYREALTRLPLDRTAPGTTGGAARAARVEDVLFDQEGSGHRAGRRELAELLGASGTRELRAVWHPLLLRRLAPLPLGGTVDLVPLARELAGSVVYALLRPGAGADASPHALAEAAAEAAAASVRSHLPGPPRPGAGAAAIRAAERLRALLGPGADARAAMLAVAAVNTTVAALPRAVAWCADAGLWDQAADPALRPALADELLRVTAASPLLPRVAAAGGSVGGCPVRAGDRLLLVARHAAGAHVRDPDGRRPAEPGVARLVFGAGPHACPGARLAREQLVGVLAALAPHRPVVTRARVDRRAALPGWRSLVVRAAA